MQVGSVVGYASFVPSRCEEKGEVAVTQVSDTRLHHPDNTK